MRVHQNIILNGKDIGDKHSRKGSKFCNEGKWDNYILPLLPENPKDMTFTEFGSNAGLYLKMAKEYGFRDVTGIELEKRNCDVAKQYRDSLGLDYKIVNARINDNFNYDLIPVSDVILLANYHYHTLLPEFIHTLDILEHRACYCLVVSVDSLGSVHWKPSPDINKTKHYFRNWEEVQTIYPISAEGDSHPRKMYSILFKSKLERLPIDELKQRNERYFKKERLLQEFIDVILKNHNINATNTRYFNYLVKEKKGKISNEIMAEFVNIKKKLVLDIKEHGIVKPVIIDDNKQLLDGSHRISILKYLKYDSVITRTI